MREVKITSWNSLTIGAKIIFRFKCFCYNIFAIKILAGNYGYDESEKLLTVPFYFASFIAEDMARGTCSIE
jgi:hypothetical protein